MTNSTEIAGDRERAIETVRRFFDALDAIDIDAFLELWADDGVQEMPFAPAGFPRRLEGRAAIRRQYGNMPQAYARMKFPDLALQPMLDPEWVLAEYRGEIELAAGGSYNNRYCGVFNVRDGKIVRFTEYFGPIILSRAFGGDALARTFGIIDPSDDDVPASGRDSS